MDYAAIYLKYLMSRQCLQKYNLHIGLKLPQLQRYCT